MPTCCYIVIEAMNAWWVDCEGQAFGPFESDEVARSEARRIALAAEDASRRAEVWARAQDGRPRRIWAGPIPG